jgi:hypothetical protein
MGVASSGNKDFVHSNKDESPSMHNNVAVEFKGQRAVDVEQ